MVNMIEKQENDVTIVEKNFISVVSLESQELEEEKRKNEHLCLFKEVERNRKKGRLHESSSDSNFFLYSTNFLSCRTLV